MKIKKELEEKMNKELKSQHRVAAGLIIFGIIVIIIFSLVAIFAWEQQTLADQMCFPVGLVLGVVLMAGGIAIKDGPVCGPTIKQKYEKLNL